jgi:hypothetical protein
LFFIVLQEKRQQSKKFLKKSRFVFSLLKINLYLCTLFHPFLIKGILGILKWSGKKLSTKTASL